MENQYLSEKDVRNIASYTRIALSEVELTQMTVYLNNVIDSLKPITKYNLADVEPTFHPIAGLANVMREDVQLTGFSQSESLANAPEVQDGQFRIPPILGGEST